MQAVISRVHRIVTTHAGGGGDGSDSADTSANASPARSPSQQQASAAATLSSLGALSTPSTSSPQAALTPRVSVSSSHLDAPPVLLQSPATSPHTTLSASVKEEIALAVERLQDATLLSERKRAVQALQTLAQSYHASPSSVSPPTDATKRGTRAHCALGDAAIPIVLSALTSDPRDTELMEAMLELLQELVSASPSTATALIEPMTASSRQSRYAQPSTPSTGVQICLELLQDPSPWIRGPTIALVKLLQDASQRPFATAVLACKEGLRRLLEVAIDDKREHIRDAALQVLVKLTEREPMVQQFLAFEDGFTHLFGIMETEGLTTDASSAGTTSVVSDCLQIVNNMVRDNAMTQSLLRETPFLETHVPLLLRLPTLSAPDSGDDDTIVTARRSYQKRRTLKLSLQLVRFLVSELYEGVSDAKLDDLARRDKQRKQTELAQIQSFVGRQRALMGAIGELACCNDEDLTDLQLQALDLLELLGTANGGNQIMLVQLEALPSHRSVLAEFVRLDCADDESPVSAAATSLLDSLFRQNETAKMAIFQQLHTPLPIDASELDAQRTQALPAGRVLFDAVVMNAEAIVDGRIEPPRARQTSTIVMWKACHRLSALLASSAFCKDLALRIPSAYDDENAHAVAGGRFLTRCLRLLRPAPFSSSSSSSSARVDERAAVFHVQIAVLCLLIQWCRECTKAVAEVVGSVANLSLLVDLFGSFDSDKSSRPSQRDAVEATHVRGLVAMLLGVCLEYVVDTNARELQQLEASLPTAHQSPLPAMTREQLLAMVSSRIGLARFTDALVAFQQAPLVVACAQASKSHSARNVLPLRAANGEDEEEDESAHGRHSHLFALYEKPFLSLYKDAAERIQKRIIAIYTSSSLDSAGAPSSPSLNAMSAYQDLIRIQDKQLQDMELQLTALQATNTGTPQRHDSAVATTATTNDSVDAAVKAAVKEAEAAFATTLEATERRHASEKAALVEKIEALEAAAQEREARYSGLTAAFEQLEADFHRQSREAPSLVESEPSAAVASDRTAELEALTAKCEALEHDLAEERALRVQGERHASLDRDELEMHHVRLEKELDALRMAVRERDEQLVEAREMVEALDAGQTLVKRENERLKQQLEDAAARGDRPQSEETLASPSSSSSQAPGEQDHATDVDALRKELASKHAELELVRETQRELERQVVQELKRIDAVAASSGLNTVTSDDPVVSAAFATGSASPRTQAARVVEQMKQHGVTLELFQLLKGLESRVQTLATHVIQSTAALEAQNAEYQVQCSTLTATVEDLERQVAEAHERAAIAMQDAAAPTAALEDDIARLTAQHATQLDELTELRRRVAHDEALIETSAAEHTEQRRLECERLERVVARVHSIAAATGDQDPVVRDLKSDSSTSPAQVLEQLETQVAQLLVRQREYRMPLDSALTPTTSVSDDVFVLLASLEIHCSALREGLRAASGDAAVAAAAAVAQARGAEPL